MRCNFERSPTTPRLHGRSWNGPASIWPAISQRFAQARDETRSRCPSHLNISLISIENKRPPSSHPFSPRYNETGMKLSPIQPPPPPFAPPNQKIPNEAIFPPIPNKRKSLTPSKANPNRLTETHPAVTILANRRRAAWPPKALLLCEYC